MGKPSAPTPPDLAAAAQQQGMANVNAALATNYLNQPNQIGPNGSMKFEYDRTQGHTLPDGTFIPQTTATTVLSPEQQRLYDQNANISGSLNDVALRGINYVGTQADTPFNLGNLPEAGRAPDLNDFNRSRDTVTNALMSRLQPSIDRDQSALDTKLSNQGINLGSKAFQTAQDLQGQRVNDARQQALLAGTNQANTQFGQGLASSQFNNQARSQSLQEQDYLRSQPLNLLNALRTGNQVSMPQFGNVAAGANVAAAPIYAAANDGYQGQMQAYNAQSAQFGSMLSGLGSIGGAAIMGSDRRLKTAIRKIGERFGLGLYFFEYLTQPGIRQIGYMADEVQKLYPEAVSRDRLGFMQVNYGMVR